MTKATSTTIKQCLTCLYSMNGKCPQVCQLSLYCPKDPAKPLLSRISKEKRILMDQLLTVFEN